MDWEMEEHTGSGMAAMAYHGLGDDAVTILVISTLTPGLPGWDVIALAITGFLLDELNTRKIVNLNKGSFL